MEISIYRFIQISMYRIIDNLPSWAFAKQQMRIIVDRKLRFSKIVDRDLRFIKSVDRDHVRTHHDSEIMIFQVRVSRFLDAQSFLMHFSPTRKRRNPTGVHAELYNMYSSGAPAFEVALEFEKNSIFEAFLGFWMRSSF